jgi:molybdopterin synthase catalytic subunit
MNESRITAAPPSLEAWLGEIKAETRSEGIGIFLMHNGIVRATTKHDGRPVCGLEYTCDRARLAEAVAKAEAKPGVAAVRVWVNEGQLTVGEDMIYALVAGDVRSNVTPVWSTLMDRIRHEVTTKRDILA